MTAWLGDGALLAAGLISALGLIAGVTTWCRGVGLRLARLAVLVQPVLVGGAAGVLLWALARSDMTLAAVADHTERSLSLPLKLAALWAGQEGSLLLWALVLSVVGAASTLLRRGDRGGEEGVRLAVFAGLGLFFAVVLLTAARPFAASRFGPGDDGVGLNPMLQHWAMVLHPPTLFAGYACAASPFAAVVAGLLSGAAPAQWLGQVRRWALASWVFLTLGISLGAWWAYVELGWGGYWAWDPVENASLMPWLAVTALLHSIVLVEERGVFPGWAAALACLAFVLCVAGTTLTRSGLLVSVHAFGATTVGPVLAGLLVVVAAGSGGLLWWRRGRLVSGHEPAGLLSRTGAILVLNSLLTGMLVATLIGTLLPIATSYAFEQQVTVGAPYYNRVVGALGLGVAAVMSLGPVVCHGEGANTVALRALRGPGAAALLGVVLALALGVRHLAALACIAITMATLLVAVASLAAAVRRRVDSAERPGWARAAIATIAGHPRRYGGQLAHLGVCLLLIGVCGSGLYARRAECTITAGDSAEVAGFGLRYEGLTETEGANYNAMEARLVATDSRGRTRTLRPQRRYYTKAMEPMTEVALWNRPGGDLYVVLAGWSPGGDEAAFAVRYNPLAVWVWIGGGLLVCGGLVAMLPRAVGVRTMRRDE